MYTRNVSSAIREALADTPVVVLHGARQTGKSTLAGWLASERTEASVLTLDDAAVLAAAAADPAGFLSGLGGLTVIDEVQRAPQLFLAMKADVDRRRSPGRFLLTGSANVMLLPRLAEYLAGRMQVITLWPLSQGEIIGRREGFVDALFAPESPIPPGAETDRAALADLILRGGFPEVVARLTPSRRDAWFDSYLGTILQRDVRDIAQIHGLADLPRLLGLLAVRSGSLLNVAELSRTAALPLTTTRRYLALLEATFLVQMLPAWSTNLSKRLVRAPKVFLADTGLAASLVGADAARLARDPPLLGPLLETFVVMEIRKQLGWSHQRVRLYHFRTTAGSEADLILETPDGRVAGVEVKSAAAVSPRDFRGLRALADALGERFVRGVVLYTGSSTVPFGDRLMAMPIEALWQGCPART